jgi:hypothetical protein
MEDSLAQLEHKKAYETRQNGNEGMSRVLARRAAGICIREYLESRGIDQRGLSLNTLIKDVEVRKHLPDELQDPLDRLSARVGMDFQFPVEFDLLLDSKKVIEKLTMLMENKGD